MMPLGAGWTPLRSAWTTATLPRRTVTVAPSRTWAPAESAHGTMPSSNRLAATATRAGMVRRPTGRAAVCPRRPALSIVVFLPAGAFGVVVANARLPFEDAELARPRHRFDPAGGV